MAQIIYQGIENFSVVCLAASFNRFLLVRGNKSYESLPDKLRTEIENHKDFYLSFNRFSPNPRYDQVCEGVDLFNGGNCGAIVAVGGGSAIDVAKCIKLFCKMDKNENYLTQKRFDSKIPLVAIPTTAGTGSESNCHAVVYLDGEKQSVSHESIIPDYAILEPSVLKTLPLYQKKCTMLDALCQAIESWWSVNSCEESVKYSKNAISLITKYWERYLFENDEEASRQIMLAANLAGRAINLTATTAPHAMSYKLTSMYNLSHGLAVSVCMPEVWEYMLSSNRDKCIDKRGEEYLNQTLKDISLFIDLNYFKQMIKRMDIQNPSSNSRERDIKILADSVNSDRLKNNPVALSSDVLKNMYKRIVRQ